MYKNYTQFNVKYKDRIWHYPKIHELKNLKYRCFYRILIQTLSKYRILGEWLEGFIKCYRPLDSDDDLIRLFVHFFELRKNGPFSAVPFQLQTPIYLENVPEPKKKKGATAENPFIETYLNWASLTISPKDRFLQELSSRYENSIKALSLPKKFITIHPASIFSEYRENLDEKHLLNDDLIDLDVKIEKEKQEMERINKQLTLGMLQKYLKEWGNYYIDSTYGTSSSSGYSFEDMIEFI